MASSRPTPRSWWWRSARASAAPRVSPRHASSPSMPPPAGPCSTRHRASRKRFPRSPETGRWPPASAAPLGGGPSSPWPVERCPRPGRPGGGWAAPRPPAPAPASAAPAGALLKKESRKLSAREEERAVAEAAEELVQMLHEASEGARDELAPEASGVDLLGQQLASGLWAGQGAGTEPVRQARATALALLELLRQGITSTHPLHGAQVKKAVEALLALMPSLDKASDVAELALGVAWLVSAGPRTRGRISQAARPLAGLPARLENEGGVGQHVAALARR